MKRYSDNGVATAACRGSFHTFFREAFPILHPATALEDNWHIKYLCDILQAEVERVNAGKRKVKDIIINVPPRSLKSMICTILFPAWAWTINPSLKFLGVSYSDSLSMEHNVSCRTVVESEWYQEHFGVRIAKDISRQAKFANEAQGVRASSSLGGAVTGFGGDFVIVDDPLNPKQASSDVERKNANTAFDTTLSTRLNDSKVGLFIVIMQRLHENDLTGHLLKKSKYNHICLPAELSKDVTKGLEKYYKGGLFFNSRFDKVELAKFRTNLGSYGFAGQYLQRPSPAEGGMIKKDWFPIVEKAPDTHWDFVCDPAYTSKESNDPSAIMCYGQIGDDYYIKAVAEKWLEFPDLLRYLVSFVEEHGDTYRSKLYVEPMASGKSIVQTLRSQSGLNVIEWSHPTKDKPARVRDIQAKLEAKRVHLIRGNWNEAFLDQCAAFPNASHDDMVDCLSMAVSTVDPNRHYAGRINFSQ